MVSEFKKITEIWPSISMILHSPSNKEDLNQLVELCDYLIDQTGGDEKHPLMGLVDIVGTLIEDFEKKNIPEPEGDAIGCLKYLMQEHGLKQKDLVELGSS